jgi:hypothetical protein
MQRLFREPFFLLVKPVNFPNANDRFHLIAVVGCLWIPPKAELLRASSRRSETLAGGPYFLV